MHDSDSQQPEEIVEDTVTERLNVESAASAADPYPSPLNIDDTADSKVATTGLMPDRNLPPGPGIGESLLWTLSCWMIQLVATIVFMMFLAVFLGVTEGGVEADGFEGILKKYSNGMIAFVQAAFVLWALIAVTLRVGRPWSHRLNLSPIDPLHFVLIVVLVLPLAILSSNFYVIGTQLWSSIVDVFPVLSAMDSANTMEQISEFANSMSLPLMLLLIAVAPAICEELIFRGLIGRGLIARTGLFWGVVITSLLFAAVHMHPAHAFGVIPLGVAMHLVYLTTKSFWAPVFLHFANNALSTIGAKVASKEKLAQMADGAEMMLLPMICGALAVGAIMFAMWMSRVKHFLPDGTEWDPGYPSVERPPLDVDAKVGRSAAGKAELGAVCLCVVLFFGALVWEGVQKAV